MSVRTVLILSLFLAVSCNRGKARSVAIDQRYGLARLDSAFALNDPYAGFGRPTARVSETPPLVRDRFRQDLETMFGADSFARAQLDSGREIIVFSQQLDASLYSYVLHVSDIIAGDRYFMYLNRGGAISEKAWSWYGPAADSGVGPRFPPQELVGLRHFPASHSTPCITVNEWRHNGNAYFAWLRTYVRIDTDLRLTRHFRYEAFSNGPLDHPDWFVARRLVISAGEGDQIGVDADLHTGHAAAKRIGSVQLTQDRGPLGAAWRFMGKQIQDSAYADFIWSANPLGDNAVFENTPDSER